MWFDGISKSLFSKYSCNIIHFNKVPQCADSVKVFFLPAQRVVSFYLNDVSLISCLLTRYTKTKSQTPKFTCKREWRNMGACDKMSGLKAV